MAADREASVARADVTAFGQMSCDRFCRRDTSRGIMTKKFKRRFAVESLDKHYNNPSSLIGALLDRWVLPGELGFGGKPPLRLAVRDGYLNLYVDGQSVAKISAPRGQPRLEVHWKYLEAFPLPEQRTSDGRTYVQFERDKLLSPGASEAVDRWIKTAQQYAGGEKRFVEHLVARNANVIDLEMGLPGDPNFVSCKSSKQADAGRSAPRMDLVLAHVADCAPVINFWEAKLANNPELRATLPEHGGTRLPHVCDQIENYERWLRIEGRFAEVKAAYRSAASISDELAKRARKVGAARETWSALAASDPKVNPRAGIIIGNYRPDGSATRFAEADSFVKCGHRARLFELECGPREVESLNCENGIISEILDGAAV